MLWELIGQSFLVLWVYSQGHLCGGNTFHPIGRWVELKSYKTAEVFIFERTRFLLPISLFEGLGSLAVNNQNNPPFLDFVGLIGS